MPVGLTRCSRLRPLGERSRLVQPSSITRRLWLKNYARTANPLSTIQPCSTRRLAYYLSYVRRQTAGLHGYTPVDRFRPVSGILLACRRQVTLVLSVTSGCGVDGAPEGVDAGVEVVRGLLEGLVGRSGQHLEPGSRDPLGDNPPEARFAHACSF